MLDSRIFRTWDEELREERRMLLLARARSVEARLSGTPFSVSVTGSLSRGQVHPWSDLDLLMYRRDGGDLGDEGRRLRAEIVFGVEFQEFDLVPVEDVPPALERGMFGSAVAVEDVPALEGLPEPRLAIARTAMSIGFALEQCRAMDRGMADGSELRKYAAMSALRDLYSKAGLWLKRLLVFQDGGRSAWLDDHEEEGALRAALERLAGPADEPFPARPCSTGDRLRRWLSLRWKRPTSATRTRTSFPLSGNAGILSTDLSATCTRWSPTVQLMG